MTTKELLKIRTDSQNKVKAFQQRETKKLASALKKWETKNIPYKQGKVYELVKNGTKRRGFTRFVIRKLEAKFFDGTIIYQCGGYWLDKRDACTKWDNMTIYGVGNPAVLKLSENQSLNGIIGFSGTGWPDM